MRGRPKKGGEGGREGWRAQAVFFAFLKSTQRLLVYYFIQSIIECFRSFKHLSTEGVGEEEEEEEKKRDKGAGINLMMTLKYKVDENK